MSEATKNEEKSEVKQGSVEKPENEAAEKYLSELKKAMADFDNYRKQVAREKQAISEEAQARAYADLLPVLDAFDNALQHEPHNEGVRKLGEQVKQILSKKGVQAFEVVGKKIDLEKSEAVEHVQSDLPEDFVARELRKGYIWRDKALRHALVSVSIGKIGNKANKTKTDEIDKKNEKQGEEKHE